jgi:hypothetical protein
MCSVCCSWQCHPFTGDFVQNLQRILLSAMFLRGEVAKASKLSEVSECWKNISFETTILGLSQEWEPWEKCVKVENCSMLTGKPNTISLLGEFPQIAELEGSLSCCVLMLIKHLNTSDIPAHSLKIWRMLINCMALESNLSESSWAHLDNQSLAVLHRTSSLCPNPSMFTTGVLVKTR